MALGIMAIEPWEGSFPMPQTLVSNIVTVCNSIVQDIGTICLVSSRTLVRWSPKIVARRLSFENRAQVWGSWQGRGDLLLFLT